MTLSDGDMDPYVNILLDGRQVGETETAEAGGNPVYNYEFETLLRSTGKRLTDHVIEFVVYDWDRWVRSLKSTIGTGEFVDYDWDNVSQNCDKEFDNFHC